MSYTTAQEKAFEALLRKVRGQDPFDIVKTVAGLVNDAEFRKLGIPPTIRALANLMRSCEWTEFVRDYEEIRHARAVSEAIGLAPDHLAKILATEMRAEMKRRRQEKTTKAASLELGGQMFGEPPAARPPEVSSAVTMDMLTGSTFIDNTALSSAAAGTRHLGESAAIPTKEAETAARGPSVIDDAMAVFSTGDDG